MCFLCSCSLGLSVQELGPLTYLVHQNQELGSNQGDCCSLRVLPESTSGHWSCYVPFPSKDIRLKFGELLSHLWKTAWIVGATRWAPPASLLTAISLSQHQCAPLVAPCPGQGSLGAPAPCWNYLIPSVWAVPGAQSFVRFNKGKLCWLGYRTNFNTGWIFWLNGEVLFHLSISIYISLNAYPICYIISFFFFFKVKLKLTSATYSTILK